MATGSVTPPTSSTTPDRQTQGGSRKPAGKPAAKPRPRDPQAAVSTGDGDLDFDEPGRAEPRATKPKPKAKKPDPKPIRDRGAQTATTKRGTRAVNPDAESSEAEEIVGESTDDVYERVAAKMDEREGRKPPRRRDEESRDDRRSERKPPRQQMADVDDEDDNLEVGDEIYAPRSRPGDDDEEEEDDDEGEMARGAETDQEDDEDDPFSKTILREAKEYGFSEEEARAFGSPGNLEKAMQAFDRQMKQLGAGKKSDADDSASKKPAEGDTSTAGETTQGSGRAAEEPPKKTIGTSATETAETGSRKPLKYEDIDPDGSTYDEGTRTIVTKMLDHYNGYVAELEGKLAQNSARFESFVKHVEEDNYLRFMDEMDDYFSGMGKEYHEVFGKGNYEDLDEETDKAVLKNRRAFVTEMSQLAKGIRQSGKNVPSRRKLRERVLRSFEPAVEKREQQIRRETLDKVDKRNRHRIAEPTHRQGRGDPSLSPEERAAEFLDEGYRKFGYDIPRRSRRDDNDDDGI